MKKILAAATISLLALSSFPQIASADTGCDGIYGGGTNCGTSGFTLTKQVADPKNTSHFVNNLDKSDPYQSGGIVYFQLTVSNNTNSDLTGVTLTDNLPQYVTFQTVAGNYQPSLTQNGTAVNIPLNTIKKGQTITVKLNGVIAQAQNLPSDPITCVVNQAQVNASNGQGAQASSQFCIQKTQVQPTQTPNQPQQTTKGGLPVNNQTQNQPQPTAVPAQNQTKGGLPVQNQQNPGFPVYTPSKNAKQTPKSGPETLPLLAMIPTGAFGMWLRRKAK